MAVININGVDMPNPKDMTVAIMDISNAERNANGTMMIDRVATKRKINLDWPALEEADAQKVLNAVSDIFFTATFIDPQLGTTTKTFYVGDRTSPVLRHYGSKVKWEGLKLNIVEK